MKTTKGFPGRTAQRAMVWGGIAGLCATFLAGASWGQAANALPATDRFETDQGELIVRPINHATFALEWNGRTIYVDPVGGAKRFEDLARPDLILITDIHGDHLEPGTLSSVVADRTALVAPKTVADKLPERLRGKTTVLANGESKSLLGIEIEAVPMYNTSPDRLRFHEKGRGNGYVLTLGGKRVYISGDTEDIPEMRALKAIDIAFVCMNLPYTMTPEQAASAVRAFKPKVVYPYHSRGSDLEKFKALASAEPGVEVRLRDWYRQ